MPSRSESIALRRRAVSLLADGWTMVEVAEELNRTTAWVRWAQKRGEASKRLPVEVTIRTVAEIKKGRTLAVVRRKMSLSLADVKGIDALARRHGLI